MNNMNLKWLLFRHAESVNNERKIWTGQDDVPLSEAGRAAAAALRAECALPPVDVVVSSPLRRCTETALLLTGREPDIIIDEFAECDLGEWTGLPYTNLTDDARYLSWVTPPYVTPPGGESLRDFHRRVMRGVRRLCGLTGDDAGTVLLVIHGNVIRAVMSNLFSPIGVDPMLLHRSWAIPNNGGYRI